MNLRADPVPNAILPTLAIAGPNLDPALLVPISDRVVAVTFDERPASPRAAPRRLSVAIDGIDLARPLISTRLELRSGGHRHVVLLGQGADTLLGSRVALLLGGWPVAAINADWLQPPIGDLEVLIDGLSDAGRRRLLRLLLTTGASLFGYGERTALGAALGNLLDLVGVQKATLASWCPTGTTSRVLSFRLPASCADTAIHDIVGLGSSAISRITKFAVHLEPTRRTAILHVHVLHPLPLDTPLIGLGSAPIMMRCPDPETQAQPLVPWFARRPAATQRWLRMLIAGMAARDNRAASLLHELQHASCAPPDLAVEHLSATPSGVLFALRLTDPHGLVQAVRIERGQTTCDIAVPEPVHRICASEAIVGYAELPTIDPFETCCRLRVVYRSGRAQTIHAATAPPFDGTVPEGFATRDDAEAARAVARARLDRASQTSSSHRIETLGEILDEPRISLVVAVGNNPDAVAALAAMLFSESPTPAVDLIWHVANGPLAAEMRARVTAVHAVFGLPCRFVLHRGDVDPTRRLLCTLTLVRAPCALLLGGDVLPTASGWLAAWLGALEHARAPGIVGGTLLGSDGRVLDAGGTTVLGATGSPAQLVARHEGLPDRDLPRLKSITTRLANADCVGLTRAGIDRMHGLTPPYPNPDILLAEAIHQLGEEGSIVRTLLQNRFVRYRTQAVRDSFEAAVDAHALGMRLRAPRPSPRP